jgi:hypothetical protein
MNKIIAVITKVFASKVGKILIDIATSATAKALDIIFPIVKESISIAEVAGNYIKANISLPDEEVIANIKALYNLDITSADIGLFRDDKKIAGLGKYNLAYKRIKEELVKQGKSYGDYIVNLAIEVVFTKYFK